MKMLKNVFKHSKKTTLGLPNNVVLILALVLALGISGFCIGWSPFDFLSYKDNQQTDGISASEGYQQIIENGAFVFVKDQAVVLTDHDMNIVISRSSPGGVPSQPIWSSSTGTLFWTDVLDSNTPTQTSASGLPSALYRYTAESGQQDTIYTAKEPLEQIAVSSNGSLISFIEQHDLYILDLNSKDIHLIQENVYTSKWVPDTNAVITLTNADTDADLTREHKTQYISLESNGAVGTAIDLWNPTEQFAEAIILKDSKTLLAVIQQSEAQAENNVYQLLQVDLRSLKQEILPGWELEKKPAEAAESADAPTVELFISPDKNSLITQAGDTHSLYSFDTHEQTDVLLHKDTDTDAAVIAGWIDTNTIATLQSEDYTSSTGDLALIHLDTQESVQRLDDISFLQIILAP